MSTPDTRELVERAKADWLKDPCYDLVTLAEDFPEYRDELAAGKGMLFIFHASAPQAFWMKNTKIPLDILFIDDTGKIVRLHARTTPFSEDSLPSDAPVRFVLEVPGGWSADNGVKEGDTVRLGGLASYQAR